MNLDNVCRTLDAVLKERGDADLAGLDDELASRCLDRRERARGIVAEELWWQAGVLVRPDPPCVIDLGVGPHWLRGGRRSPSRASTSKI